MLYAIYRLGELVPLTARPSAAERLYNGPDAVTAIISVLNSPQA